MSKEREEVMGCIRNDYIVIVGNGKVLPVSLERGSHH